MMPLGVNRFRWYPCIESSLVETKTLLLTDSCSQCERRIIGVLMPKCCLSVMEEVLPIEEGNSSLGLLGFAGLLAQESYPKNNPAGAFRQVRRGVNTPE